MNGEFVWCADFVWEAGLKLPIRFLEPVPYRFAGVMTWFNWGKLLNEWNQNNIPKGFPKL